MTNRLASARNYASSRGVNKLVIFFVVICVAIIAYFVFPPFTGIVNTAAFTVRDQLLRLTGLAVGSAIFNTYVIGFPYVFIWSAPLFIIIGIGLFWAYDKGMFWGHKGVMKKIGVNPDLGGSNYNPAHEEARTPPLTTETTTKE